MSNDPKKNNQQPNGNNNNENDIKGRRILFLVLAALIATLLINTLYTSISKSYLTEVRYDEFLTMLDNGEISELEFQSDDRVVYAKKSDTDSSGAAKKLYYTGLIPNQDTTELTHKLDEKGVKYNRELPQETSPVVSFIVSWLLPVNIMYAATRDIKGKAAGQMIIELPDHEPDIERVLQYLDRAKVPYEEVGKNEL